MRILMTGAGGLLGTDVTRVADAAGHETLALTHDELDVRDAAAVRRRFERERPAAVVNCAAYTDVDGAEDDLRGAMDVNAESAEAVATAAMAAGASASTPRPTMCSTENLELVRRILELAGPDDSLIEHVADRPGHDRR